MKAALGVPGGCPTCPNAGKEAAMRYSPEEIEVIRKNYRGRGPAWVAAKLGRSYSSVVTKANQLGLCCGDPPTPGAIAIYGPQE